jgi:CubicO group peptidase (beta-lactamase class C family)
MHRILSLLTLSFFAFLATATLSGAHPSDSITKIERSLQERANEGTFSGTVLVARRSEVLFVQGFSLADREKAVANTPSTPFNICSMGKTFTATAVMLLVDDGKIDVQSPIGDYLPDIPKELAESITVHHLLSHSAGLGNYMGQAGFESKAHSLRTIDGIYELVKSERPAFAPGARFHYSNSGYILLGKIIEEVSGQSYFDFVRRQIFKPTGMEHSEFYYVEERPEGVAIGYTRTHGSHFIREPHVVPNPASDGGVHSTVGDLLKFNRALHGGALVSEPSRDLMFRPNRNGYGYGLSIKPGDEHISGKFSIGHTGGLLDRSAVMRHFVEDDTTVIVLSNLPRVAFEIAREIEAILYSR